MLAIPSLIFALAIMAILGPGLTSLLIALGLTNWSFTCRLARASALSLEDRRATCRPRACSATATSASC